MAQKILYLIQLLDNHVISKNEYDERVNLLKDIITSEKQV